MNEYWLVRRKLKDGGSVPIGATGDGLFCAAFRDSALKFADRDSAVRFMVYCGHHGPKLVSGQIDEYDVAHIPAEA